MKNRRNGNYARKQKIIIGALAQLNEIKRRLLSLRAPGRVGFRIPGFLVVPADAVVLSGVGDTEFALVERRVLGSIVVLGVASGKVKAEG